METCVCKYCGKLFWSYRQVTTCRDCIKIDNEKFKVVEQYLLKHPGSNAIQLANELDIKIGVILEYINEGRLVIMDNTVQIPDN